jgi:hypothetical protein
MYENRMPRKVFGSKREEVIRECSQLHNEIFDDLYPSGNNITVIRFGKIKGAGHVSRKRQMRIGYKVLVGMPER